MELVYACKAEIYKTVVGLVGRRKSGRHSRESVDPQLASIDWILAPRV